MAAGNGFGFESGNNNDTLTDANSGSSVVIATGGTAVISTADKMHGTRAALFTATTTSGALYFADTSMTTDDIAVRLYVKFTSLPSGGDISLIWLGAGTSQLCNIDITSTGLLRIRNDAFANIWTSSATISTDVWYRIEFAVHRDPSAGTARLAAFVGDSDTPVSGMDSGVLTAQNTGAASITSLRIGAKASTSTTASTLFLDDWDYDPTTTTLIGPYTETLDTPVVTVTDTTNPTTIGGSDGTITITWPAVDGADHYEVAIEPGVATEFTTHDDDATSPYTFTGLTAGTYTVATRAMGS